MGKTRNAGIGYGTSGSIQLNSEQNNVSAKIDLLAAREKMLLPLIEANVKFTPKDVLFVTKDKNNQLIWLEKGNKYSGLEHILYGDGLKPGHISDFKKAFNVDLSKNPEFLSEVISTSDIVSYKTKIIGTITGYEKIYEYEDTYVVVVGIGTNGFIVSAYPRRRKK